jgi:hypothetical protein
MARISLKVNNKPQVVDPTTPLPYVLRDNLLSSMVLDSAAVSLSAVLAR